MKSATQYDSGDPYSAVPQPPAEAFRGALEQSLEQYWIAGKFFCLDQSLNGRFDMPDAHGDAPPVENMFYLAIASDGISDEVWESRLAVRDHCQQTAWLPSKGRQPVTHTVAWRHRSIDDQAKSPAYVSAFDLAYHKIWMSLLIFRPTANMRAVQQNRQTTFGNRVSEITRRPAGLRKPLRNPPQPVPHCHVMGRVTGQETLHQSCGFPKRMPGTKLGM